MSKEIKPSEQYLKKLLKLRENTREAMLGNDPESQAELRYLESKIVQKIKEVQRALGKSNPRVVR